MSKNKDKNSTDNKILVDEFFKWLNRIDKLLSKPELKSSIAKEMIKTTGLPKTTIWHFINIQSWQT